MADYAFYYKEARTLIVTFTESGSNLNVSGATITMSVKRELSDTTDLFTKSDTDWTKNYGGNNYQASVALSSTNLAFTGAAYGIIKLTWSASSVKKAVFTLLGSAAYEA